MRGSFDTDSMNSAARQLEDTADALRALAGQLDALPHGAVPPVLVTALDALSSKGKTMISQIDDETTTLSDGLRQAARSYEESENSIIRAYA
jgi:hypothetical protein